MMFENLGKIIYTNEIVKSKRTITKIVIHCLQTPVQRADSAEDVHQWHLDKNWSGIGYHYVIQADGTLQVGRGIDYDGAHVYQHNKNTIGVAMAGGMTVDKVIAENTFTKDTLYVLDDLIRKLMCMYPDVPIYGHREIDAHRSCPCMDIPEFIKGMRCLR